MKASRYVPFGVSAFVCKLCTFMCWTWEGIDRHRRSKGHLAAVRRARERAKG